MTVFLPGAPVPIIFQDSGAISPFGRLKISTAQSIFTNNQQYGDDSTIWESAFVGTGANTFLPNESTIQMTTGGTGSTASCIRQTRLYHRYTPGHDQTVLMTFVMDGGATVTNNTRRVGYFDANNGIFLEVAGTTVSLCQRTNTSGTPSDAAKISQASWNIDTFGAGSLNPSGLTINWSKAQILYIDLQWLGVGRVRIGFDINGIFYPAHYFENANNLTTVYMTTANLPCRLENFNTGTASGTATLRHICSSISTDGGAEQAYGHQYAYNNGPSGLSIGSGNTVPVISVHAITTGPNSVRNTGQICIEQYDIFINSLNAIFWQLVLNPTLTGASFSSYGTNSIAQVDHSATTVSGGTVLDAGFLSGSSSSKGSASQQADIKQLILAYSGLLNYQDTMTLVCTAVGGAAVAVCNLQWLELW